MSRMLFINLPVADLEVSRAFFRKLGFRFNDTYSDHTAACMVISEVAYVMLLSHEKFSQFSKLPRPDPRATTGVLTAISLTSRNEVDEMSDAALANGGSVARPPEDLGFMFTRAIADPDGNIFELFWMDRAG